MITFFRNL